MEDTESKGLKDATQPANGDNSIPKGDDAGLVHRMAGHMTGIMRELNLDLGDPNFVETPERVAKMYLEMFHGLREGHSTLLMFSELFYYNVSFLYMVSYRN